jgi:hypothetical protein
MLPFSARFGDLRSVTAGPDRRGDAVKSLHLASIFALSLSLTLACGDDDGDATGAAGSSGAAAGGDNGAGEGPVGGKGGTEAGGAGGAPAETCEFGVYEDAEESAAGAGGGGQASIGHELVGTWEEEFVGAVEITSAHWGSSGIAAYDSEANVLYTQSPCDAAYNPGRFSKIVYTEPTEDAFYYCTVVFDAKTLEEAQASDAAADPEDLDAGCGQSGFPWSKATR